MAYNPNFQWKIKTVTIAVPTSSLPAGYQVKLLIPKETEMQSDFRDLRFEYTDGSLWYGLPYWIESIVSNTATVWIKLKDLVTAGPSVTVTVYMYYGNPYVSSASNGTNTFDLFDDFSGSSLDTSKWDYTGSPVVSNSVVSGGLILSKQAFNAGYSARVLSKRAAANDYPLMWDNSLSNNQFISWRDASGLWKTQTYPENILYDTGISIDTNFHKFEIAKLGTTAYFWMDGTLYTSNSASNTSATKLAIITTTVTWDWILVRKYVTTEPATPTIGSTVTPANWNPQRKKITINTITATPANYQVKITVPFAPEMNTDFSDLRFVSKGVNPIALDYWIEPSTTGVTADVWVKLTDAILASSSDYIYMHYGNPNLTSVSNGNNTFETWAGSARNWTAVGSTTITDENNSVKFVCPSTYGGGKFSVVNKKTHIFEADINVFAASNFGLTVRNFNSSNLGIGSSFASTAFPFQYTSDNSFRVYNGVIWYNLSPDKDINYNTFYHYKFIFDDNTNTISISIDGTNYGSYGYEHTATTTDTIQFLNAGSVSHTAYAKNARIRQYIITEPTFSIDTAEAMNTFSKRKTLTINNNSGGTLADYQIPITVTYASAMQANFNDIRFIDANGNLLPYWIESKTDSTTALFWIKVNLPLYGTSPTGDNTVYMYYGNPNLTSVSDGTNTFDTFYDLRGLSNLPSGWQSSGTVNLLPNGISVDFNGYAITTATYGKNANTILDQYVIMPAVSNGGTSHYVMGFADTGMFYNGGSSFGHNLYGANYASTAMFETSTPNHLGISAGLSYGTSGISSLRFDNNVYWRINYGSESNVSPAPASALPIGINNKQQAGTANPNGILSWIRIRKYVANEPTVTTGSEQTPSGITADSMTITKSENPCRTGFCTVTVNVTWRNDSLIPESFIPSIKINGTPAVVSPPLTVVTVDPSGTKSQEFIMPSLLANTYTICPDPN